MQVNKNLKKSLPSLNWWESRTIIALHMSNDRIDYANQHSIQSLWYQELSWWNPGWAVDFGSNLQWQAVRPGMWPTRNELVLLLGACIEWGNNVISCREHSMHIDIRKHYAHEVIQNGDMKLVSVSNTSQLAVLLTKPLHYQQFWRVLQASSKVVTSSSGGYYHQGYQVESRRPFRGVCHRPVILADPDRTGLWELNVASNRLSLLWCGFPGPFPGVCLYTTCSAPAT